MTLFYPPTINGLQKQLDADLNSGVTASLTLTNTTGVQNKPGVIVVNRIDTNGVELSSALREYISFTGTSGATLTGLARGLGGSSDQDHSNGAVVEFIWDVTGHEGINATFTTEHDTDGTHGTITTATLNSPKIDTGLFDTGGNEVIKTPATASAVNELTVTNAATGNAPELSATGGDTNIDLKLKGKGTGHLQAYDNTSASYFDVVPNSSMSRQAIMNGNFDVWQRGTSTTLSDATITRLADRWFDYAADDGGTLPTLTRTRQSLTAGELSNAFYFTRLNTNGAGTSLGNSSIGTMGQRIEFGTRFLCGNGKKVTISFWARSDIANKKIWPVLIQNYGTTGSPTSQEHIAGTSITLTSTLTQYTQTFTTNTLSGKTFGTSNNDYLALELVYQWGSTTASSYGLSGTETYVGSGNIDIAQVQLCAGEVALPFQPKSYAQELADCQRYYYRLTNNGDAMIAVGAYSTTTQFIAGFNLPVSLRTTATSTDSGDTDFGVLSTSTNRTVASGLSFGHSITNPTYVRIICTTGGSATAGVGGEFRFVDGGTVGDFFDLSAEL